MNLTTKYSAKKLGTHNGQFHCDEVFGSYMLKLLFPNLDIIRTRDEELLRECDIVIDVGGVYDHEKCRYDHHQKSFTHSMSSLMPDAKWTTKLSSAGLIYLHYGHEVLNKIIASDIPESKLKSIYFKVYENFVQEVDAIDNGIPICEGKINYSINTDLASRVSTLNKKWNHVGEFNENKAFEQAMKLVGSEFEENVQYAYHTWLPARSLVISALDKRFQTHKSGRILELSSPCPWKEHYFLLEEELGNDLNPKIDYVIFQDVSNNSWRIQAMPISVDSFELRRSLPKSWCGLRDDELSTISGVQNCVFCHINGFIGGNKSRAGVIEMAEKAIGLDLFKEPVDGMLVAATIADTDHKKEIVGNITMEQLPKMETDVVKVNNDIEIPNHKVHIGMSDGGISSTPSTSLPPSTTLLDQPNTSYSPSYSSINFPAIPNYNPTSPDYSSSLKYWPTLPYYTSTSPSYRPSLSTHRPISPEYKPISPINGSASSTYLPGSPSFRPLSPEYTSSLPIYRPSSPEYTSSLPIYRPLSPEYRPTSPEYRPVSPTYIPLSSGYSPLSSVYSPKLTEYRSVSPTYRSTSPSCFPFSPEYSSISPEHNPTSSTFSSTIPEYRSTSPNYSPSSPSYQPMSLASKSTTLDTSLTTYRYTSLEYSHTSLTYTSTSLEYSCTQTSLEHRLTSPEYRPTTPEYRPISPSYMSTLPEYNSLSAEHRPTSPGYNPLSAEYTSTSPELSSLSAEYRPTSSEYSSLSAEYTPTPRKIRKFI
ncbi:Metal-dependent protein hydrolase,RNA polymerase II, heptapeptide repeat, eukaryotic [Cinara cedri]|uniref:Metal-dependent protein hydrolase,RNA polymerase II, heptapeptide repeat, eukaryotic n=1 Tax=Cinara cedri TaxID=506608 RepID=A0A5E4NLR2_9HEMI|nr:Metal-dependent protein hydrolase,RNA polymerase II, heptapeptide repeat, eukaryotic [Cinara cedri]